MAKSLILLLVVAVSWCVDAAPNHIPWLKLESSDPVQSKKTNDILMFEPMTPFDTIWAAFKEEHGTCCYRFPAVGKNVYFISTVAALAKHFLIRDVTKFEFTFDDVRM